MKNKIAPKSLTPVSLITGFLGCGKTTFINQLIKHPKMDKVVILVNEFGEIGLDHLLIEAVNEDIILMPSGCICCQIKDDLATTLEDLYFRRERGEIDNFDRVLIETTGIADPVPVLQVLIADPTLIGNYRFDSVITLVDSVLGKSQLERHLESKKQVALAHQLILTKVDLAEEYDIDSLIVEIKKINPTSDISPVVKGQIDPDKLFNSTPLLSQQKDNIKAVNNWLEKSKLTADINHDGHSHHSDISSVSIKIEQPIDWECFKAWLDSLLFSRSDNILRLKGILNLSNSDKPCVIQGIQHIFYPPIELSSWPTNDKQSCIVFITCNLDPKIIERSLKDYLAIEQEG